MSAATDVTLVHSSELMTNYLQAEVIAPDAKFAAVQIDSGAALLVSIGTDRALYLTAETPAARSGWERANVSAAQVASDFPGKAVTCKDFAVARSAGAGKAAIDLAMVISDGTDDHLYLSLGNSGDDTSWLRQPAWVAYPFDAAGTAVRSLQVAGIMISDASDGEYVVVDVIADPSSSEALVSRYYIDSARSGGSAWHPHRLTIDLEASGYVSCLGRPAGGGKTVDGLYMAGRVSGSPQFIYQPLYNAYDRNLPGAPSLFGLPGGAAVEALATCRNADDSSDLYVAAAGALYRMASDDQGDDATPVELFANAHLAGIRSLYAELDADTVVVWGLNGSDEVFYTACPAADLADGGAWSVPVPILSGVEQIAPFVNSAQSSNTFFAHTGAGTLTKATKSPDTLVWSFHAVTLDPPDAMAPARSFSSYTTRVDIAGADGAPASNASVSISATNVTSVWINALYHLVGPEPVQVTADAAGALTIVEPVEALSGTRLTVVYEGVTTVIDPMAGPFGRLTSLTTPAQLSGATVTAADGSSTPLVPPGTSDADLQLVASGNGQLAKAYASVNRPPAIGAGAAAARRGGLTVSSPPDDLGAVLIDAGDLLCWVADRVERDVEYVARLVQDDARQAWQLVVRTADLTYCCVLDCVEQVVAAAQWLFAMLKTAVTDTLAYLEFVVAWDDVKRTKEVFVNLVSLFLALQVDQVEVLRSDLDRSIAGARQSIDGWAGVGDWSGLGSTATTTVGAASTPTAGQSAPGSLLAHHFASNAGAATAVGSVVVPDPSPDPIAVLLEALNREGDTLGDAIGRLDQLAGDAVAMPLEELLRGVVDVVGDAALDSAGTVADALLDVLYDVATATLSALETPIHVPVVSDVLAGIGVQEASLLDVVCWTAALPVTVACKAATGAAPFPDDADTSFLIGVRDYETLAQAFSPPTAVPRAAAGAHLSPGAEALVHAFFHQASGLCSLLSAIVSSLEAADELADNGWSVPSAVLGAIGGGTAGLANWLAPREPVQNHAVSLVGDATTAVRLLAKLLFSGPVQKRFAGTVALRGLSVSDGRGVGAICDAVLVIPALVCTAWHLHELSAKPAASERTVAILDETSSLTSYIARISYAVAVNTEGPPRAVAIGVMAGANVCTGGLQIAESAVR
ncbi:hypothetical protein Q5424_21170 [Conexibacter sp. JD483]|uniref:hypothetical protein n=1 Tax=unclassified Conexibacter TaxID=2627773 RepID=UPI00271FE64F|nr:MULTISPECIES: hypothetical protein [unclassified Conexibacter]MDO8188902.1 hypothetical protein [Conexibacter sp. CPCC 205706]MDO8200257.1 hypothetical protein [Conexibacter sp. CPCC 205762]MDR9371622.1 hypothetical protein [Conexibacter sp. JD483]